jgi:hypothetical protein
MENWSAVSGIISGSIDLFHFVKEHIPRTSSPEKKVLPALISPPVQDEQEPVEKYQVQLGRRHKYLREDILDLDRREMANFYGFKKAEQLEDCEAGLDEFPTEAMKKLEEIFFINPKYLQKGENLIFQSFISYPRDDCRRFLEQGFYPYFLCAPSFQKDGLAYLVFWKEDKGYRRMIRSCTEDSFYSGGSANSICSLIYSMLDLNVDLYRSNISYLNVSEEEWEKLSNLSWYNKGILGCRGNANNEARKIYEGWFEAARTELMSRSKKLYIP